MPRLEWHLHSVSSAHGLQGSYMITFFLGAIPDSIEEWSTSDALLGVVCQYCDSTSVPPEYDYDLHRCIPLQKALRRAGFRDSDVVLPFLRKNIRWRVQMANGDVVDPKDFPSHRVYFSSRTEEQKLADEFTKYPL